MDEILNIRYHELRLLLIALNKYKTINEALAKCGMSKGKYKSMKFECEIKKDNNGVYQGSIQLRNKRIYKFK
jgi:hypothetical protein